MLSQFFIRRPIFASVISILIVLMGAVAYVQLPVEQYPELAPPAVRVSAQYPGANAETIANTVAAPLEEQINGVEDMLYMSSTSSDGQYALDISFEPGTDVDEAAVLVQNRVSIAEPRLPEEVRRLGVTTLKRSSAFVGVIALYSPDGSRDDLFLSNYVSLRMRDEFARVAGVGDLFIVPAKTYGMRIWLDPGRLESMRLTMGDINAAIRQQNVQVAAGVLGRQPAPEGQAFELFVTTLGRLSTPEQFGQIIVKAEDGAVVRLKDVARIELGARDYTTLAGFNNQPAALMIIFQLPGSNLVDVAERCKALLEDLQPQFPAGVEGTMFYDASTFIEASIEEVQHTLVEAFILVFIVVFVFLQSFRMTLIPMITIPVALIGTFLFMALFGFSINMLTMLSLVLAIGIVVDDAIIVVENVERNLLETGLPPREATSRAMMQITGAVIAITLVLVSVFIPTAALPGVTGAMYRQFALTIAASTFISAVNALTLSPALCAVLLRRHDPNHQPGRLQRALTLPSRLFNRAFDATSRGYGRLAYYTIRFAPVTLVLFAAILLATGYLYNRVPGGFVPDEDLGIVLVSVTLPDGASLERTEEVMRDIVERTRGLEGVARVNSFIGYSFIEGQGVSYGTAMIGLAPWEERLPHGRTVEAITADVQQAIMPIQEASLLIFNLPPIPGIGTSAGFDLRLLDQRSVGRATLQQAVQAVTSAASTQSQIAFAFSSFRAGVAQYFLDIDREKAIKLGVSLASLFETLQTALGSTYVNDFNLFNRTYQVNTQADAPYRLEPEDILRLQVRNSQGGMVPLGTLLQVDTVIQPDRVTRYNLYPSASITGAQAPGVSSGEARQIMAEIAEDRLPEGVGYAWTGLSFQEEQAEGTGNIALMLAILVVYLILAAQYESWTAPLAVVFTVPLVAIGTFIALTLTGLDNNVFTQIGLVLLVGLGAKNAILIVEFARQNHEQGMSITDAAIEAARARLRPILMTSFAFILGVVPLAIATGAGAGARRAMGTAVVGGMLGVTVLSLLFTPMLYAVVTGLTERVSGLFRRGGAAPNDAPGESHGK